MWPWKCHSGHFIESYDECNNCTKLQFYTEQGFGDIPFFVILFPKCDVTSNLICINESLG